MDIEIQGKKKKKTTFGLHFITSLLKVVFITGPSPYHQKSKYNQINSLQTALKYDLQQDINKHENEKDHNRRQC